MRKSTFFFAAVTLVISASGAVAAPTYVPCYFPNGWNSTDAHRELAGTPNGMHHQCLVENRAALEAGRHRRRARQ
jgi:hypothetical protein